MNHEVEGFPGREITVKGRRFLYFGGTAYLGLQTNEAFQDILIKNIKKFGSNYGASRKANVRLPIYEKTEKYLANVLGSESCITLSSGYLTGHLIAKYFHLKAASCFYAPNTHEALHLQRTKNYPERDALVEDLNEAIDNNANAVLFLDSISLDAKNHPDFKWLEKVPLEKITLVVDDSHGLGIVGENGGGVFRTLKEKQPKELLVCGSLGKGFGIQAGILAGSHGLINDLKNSDIFAAASPTGAAFMATLLESHEIVSENRKLLFENIEFFLANLLIKAPFKFISGYPCFAFEDSTLSTYLLENGIIITNFHYPTEKDDLVQRIVLSAHHRKSDIQKLAKSINEYFSK